jgi:predicted nucleotidyltransferase
MSALTLESDARLTGAIREAFGSKWPVILLGSRATGTALATSDYDVLVVTPLLRLPFVLGRLERVGTQLGEELGVSVSVNPLPPSRLSRRESLFTWKVRREGRVLWAPRSFELTTAGKPPMSDRARFSYAASAALFLLEAAVGNAEDRAHRLDKCVLHLAQLRLLETDRYESTLERALAALDDRRFTPTADFAAARDLLVDCLEPLIDRVARTKALRINTQYLILAALRRRALPASALSRRAVDASLMQRAVALLRTIDDVTDVDDETGRSIRHVLAEWPDAHPLGAQ